VPPPIPSLHLNPTGYQKMTDTVDITLMTK